MAHRGSVEILGRSLQAIKSINCRPSRIRIGLDQHPHSALNHIRQTYPDFEWYRVVNPPVGPYPIRNFLTAGPLSSSLTFFCDSDDFCTFDRFYRQFNHFSLFGGDMVGSHELRIDTIQKQVIAVRFPLDAHWALKRRPNHVLYHPTTLIKREAFIKNGEFSTDRRFGADTQFLIRARFLLDVIGNIDQFLYVRVKRPHTLSTARKTALGSPARIALEKAWRHDYDRVGRGKLALTASSLAVQPSSNPAEIIPWCS